MLRYTNKIILLLLLTIFLGGMGWFFLDRNEKFSNRQLQGEKQVWYCPMHPWIKNDKPGSVCPICGMALVPWHQHSEAPVVTIPGYVPIEVSQQKEKLAGIRTALVGRRNIVKTIRAAGYISTNNDLYQLQDEYVKNYMNFIVVYRDAKRYEHTRRNWETHRELQLKLHDLEDKLLRMGIGMQQIKELQKFSWTTPWNQPDLLFLNDSFEYWAQAQIFEQDLEFVKIGQEAEVEIHGQGPKVKGIVRSIGGIIDPQTRTVNVLIKLKGPTGVLKGNMFVNIYLPVALKGMIAIPSQAVMDTGLRKIVFVQNADNKFEPREIQTGLETDNLYEVRSGLLPGERIAVSGNFLLDSEARVQASLQAGGQS